MTVTEQATGADRRTAAWGETYFGAALRGRPVTMATVSGETPLPHGLATSRWSGPADESDRELLAHCDGPTLDVGCGPGRMAEHLQHSGVDVLGIDVVPEAVAQTRARGASALERDVYARLPGEGGWTCALLADGNIGIGGDPVALLRRVADVLEADGWVVTDLSPPGTRPGRHRMRLECDGRRSAPFWWSVLGVDDVAGYAAAAGLWLSHLREHDGRWFGVLRKNR